MEEKQYVTYEAFGAAGDGSTDDFPALAAAHAYANEHHLPVRAMEGKTYRLHNSAWDGEIHAVAIRTDTDWTGATIVADDTDIGALKPDEDQRYRRPLFCIESDYPAVSLEQACLTRIREAGGLRVGETTRIDVGLGYPAMLILRNANVRQFIRYGNNQSAGGPAREIVMVDADGNIDPQTPLLFDFPELTDIQAYRVDIPPLTLRGGTFVTKACRINLYPKWAYVNRGIAVTRPHTRILDLCHKIEGEFDKYEAVYTDEQGLACSAAGDGYIWRNGVMYDKTGAVYEGEDVRPFTGHCYSGFINANSTHDVELTNVTFQSRIYYLQGTYDLCANSVDRLVCRNCRQSNFYAGDPQYPLMPSFGKWWGVAGTNYCKNMVYENCLLTRYDAHTSVVNGRIKNCIIGGIRLNGGGDMVIEDSKLLYWGSASPISFREDFGSTWRGTVTIRNCEFVDVRGEGALRSIFVLRSPNWNFGYRTYSPNLVLDNVQIQNAPSEIPLYLDFSMEITPNGFFYRSIRDAALSEPTGICADGKPNVNPYTPPAYLRVVNNEQNGYVVTVPQVPFFDRTGFQGIKRSQ